MNQNEEFTKKIFNIVGRLKRSDIMNINNSNNDLRPSEEMFLLKINMLSDNNDVKVNDLVNNLRFAPSTVSTILKTLEDNGYVVRSVNEDNRREVLVKVTSKGKNKLETTKKMHFDMVSDLITYLGENDARKLIEILEKTTCFFEMRKHSERDKQQ